MSNQTIYMFPFPCFRWSKKVKSLNSKVTHFRDGIKPKLPIFNSCLFCGSLFVYHFLILLIQHLYQISMSKYSFFLMITGQQRTTNGPENWTHSIALKMNFSGESFGDITCMNNVPNETLERIKVEPIKKGIFWGHQHLNFVINSDTSRQHRCLSFDRRSKLRLYFKFWPWMHLKCRIMVRWKRKNLQKFLQLWNSQKQLFVQIVQIFVSEDKIQNLKTKTHQRHWQTTQISWKVFLVSLFQSFCNCYVMNS